MKKLITAALAAAMMVPMAAPAMADPGHGQARGHDDRGHGNGNGHGNGHGNRQDFRDQGRHGGQQNWQSWRKGQRFDRNRAQYYSQIDYRRYHGLRAPPRGYHWVRSGNDAVLVAITTGIIASVIAGAIR
jgi:Ni/Co efflux regulator RcnB